jgi:SRSO17 transposase
MGLTYVVGIQSSAQLWLPGSGALPPKAWSGQGRPPTLMRRDAQNKPQSAGQLARSLSDDAYRTTPIGRRLARRRLARRRRQNFAFPVRQPARAARASGLLALAALSRRMAARRMAARRKRADQILALDLAGRYRPRDARCSRQMRWRIERDYQELKQELGLDP